MPGYRFWKDPVWVVAVMIYAGHRFYQAHHLPEASFFQYYLNDLLFIPAVLPLVVTLENEFHWRSPGPPRGFEILFYGVIWSLICEWVGPFAFGLGSADGWDVVAYAAGGLMAWAHWRQQDEAAPPKQPITNNQ